jgi:hypothetical protein
MPLRERRNLTVQLVCQRPGCGTLFHPFRGRESGPTLQKYCGHACSVAAGVLLGFVSYDHAAFPLKETDA